MRNNGYYFFDNLILHTRGGSIINTAHYESPVGAILIAEKDGKIIGVWIEGQKYYLMSIKDELVEKETPILSKAMNWLDRYFAGKKPEINELELSPIGSHFRQSVWEILCEIPYGDVTTYGVIAKRLAQLKSIGRMSAQAVGGAVGHNPISIIIPCHRVIGTNGSLTGYAGGIDIKEKLLIHEGVDMSSFFVPKKRD